MSGPIDCGPAELAGAGVDVEVRLGDTVIYETPLETALRRAFGPAELAELRDGMAEVRNLVRGAGGLAARPLAVTDGPFDRLLSAVRAAAGDTVAPATSRGLAPLVTPVADVPGTVHG